MSSDPGKVLCYILVDEAFKTKPWHVKIGRSKHPDQRRNETPGTTLERHVVLGKFEGDEFAIHADLEPWRVTGKKEWFQWCEEVRTYLVQRWPHLLDLPPARSYGPPVKLRRPPRATTRNGNPGSHAEKTNWVGEPEGRFAKWIILLRAQELSGGDAALVAHFGNWKERFGITEDVLMQAIEERSPGFFGRWPARRNQCFNRLFYYFKKPKPNIDPPAPSGEHPHLSKRLSQYEQHAIRVFRGRQQLTVEEIRRWFSPSHPPEAPPPPHRTPGVWRVP